MAKSVNTLEPLVSSHEPAANNPLVAPEQVTAGEPTTAASKALSAMAISQGLSETLHKRAEEAKARQEAKIARQEAIAAYFETIDANKEGTASGFDAAKAIEAANASVARAFCDSVIAGNLDRKAMRAELGAAFGFAESDKTGKPTSKPLEPGNTIAKRVASVAIAAEYAHTGTLPDKGGDSLGLLEPVEVLDKLADYFTGDITVRAASERIEAAIREARVTIPLEMSAEKVEALAGKILAASAAIAQSDALREAYGLLFSAIAAVPFPAKEG